MVQPGRRYGLGAGIAAACGILALAAGCNSVNPNAVNVPGPPRLLIIPEFLVLHVGESGVFTAEVEGQQPPNLTWSSEAPPTATVDENGTVYCASVGETQIVASSHSDDGSYEASEAAPVTCQALEASQARIQVHPDSLKAEHVVGQTGCPQTVGEVVVENLSGAPISVSATVGDAALDASPDHTDLAPGEQVTIRVRFLCTTTKSFSSQLSLLAVGNGLKSQTVTVPVEMNIHN